MSSQHITTSVEVMNTASAKVLATSDDIQAVLARVRSEAESTRAHWSGEAQIAFSALMQRWDDNSRTLNQALRGISDNLKANAQAYSVSETDNAAALKQAAGALNL